MTLMLELPSELEQQLTKAASRHGLAVEDYALGLLKRGVPASVELDQAAALVESWIAEGDENEQRETGDYLIRALDQDRTSERKLFPSELEGITW
jgi:hypothetical protein